MVLDKKSTGIALISVITIIVFLLNHYLNAPLMITALIAGIALNKFYTIPVYKDGIAFTGKTILRVGIALLGLRISLGQIMDLGFNNLMIAVFLILATILFTVYVAKLMKLDSTTGVLFGGAVGICGASAGLAISSVLPDRNKKLAQTTLCAIICVNILSTIAMVLYPMIAQWLEFTPMQTGIVFGFTIHDVAQVVGAGLSISPQVMDTALIAKLVRVSLLSAVVILVSLAYRSENEINGNKTPILPMFLVMFLILATLNSINIIPEVVSQPLLGISKIFLVASIIALGMKTQINDLKSVGIKPIILSVIATLFIGVVGFIIVAEL